MTKRRQDTTVRTLLLAALAAWVITMPSIAAAQQRGEPPGRARLQQPQQHDVRRGGLYGMLREIAGARLNRAHAAQRFGRPSAQPDRGGRRR